MLRALGRPVLCNRHQLWTKRSVHTVSAASVQRLKEGDRLHGYTVEKISAVPELFISTVSLRHDQTGAQHLHLDRDDNNNAFSVMFRTTPMDSTGVPHILEHTVLCGSKRFPVRDPFFKMLNRSLATFMNAMTASDWTIYPFSTQNSQDYRNLLSIYLDAVFYPQLRELDFSQEGWRLEHQDPNNPDSPIIFKGVVYNEMKGVFSSNQSIYQQSLENQLYPSHTYGVVSGGDPAVIPDLSWSDLVNFHRTHYHPSNSKFVTYGNFPLEDHLDYINHNYLSHFSSIDPNTAVPTETRWDKPRHHTISCRPDPMSPDPQKQTTVSISYLLSDITDLREATALTIIGTLLTDSETSPFYQSLLEASLGSDYSPGTGYQGYSHEGSFSVGLQGIKDSDVETVTAIIEDTLDRVIQDGFDQEQVDAILHRIELSTKHQSSNFGFSLIMSISSLWNHDGSPVDALTINTRLQQFMKDMKDNPRYLQDKVKQYFKDNPHKLTLVMRPDEEYDQKLLQRENTRLAALTSHLGPHEREELHQRGLKLLEKQMQTEDLSCLPTIHIADIERSVVRVPTTVHHTSSGVPVYCCAQPTNEITYIHLIADTSYLPDDLKTYLPLFTDVLTRMGAGIWNYKELSQLTDLYTGGLGCSLFMSGHHTDTNTYEQSIKLSSHCLERNLDRMLELWQNVISRPNFSDRDRLKTLIRMSASDLASGLSGSGHMYALGRAASTLSPLSQWKERFSGVTHVNMMKSLAELTDVDDIVAKLEHIAGLVLNFKNIRVSVNATEEAMSNTVDKLDTFLHPLTPEFTAERVMVDDSEFKPSRSQCQTHVELPFSVNYVSKCFPSVRYTHPDSARLTLLAKLMSAKFLHREIREKGGAYGSGAMNGDNTFNFFSYRDPNSLQTLDVFDRAIEWAVSGQFTDQHLDEAKLSYFQQIDKPVPPSGKGLSYFLHQLTDDLRQTNRDRVFAATKQDLVEVANKYLLSAPDRPSGVAILGPHLPSLAEDPSWNILKS
ncbi:presequence protease, mitochondrial-like [Argonauta hians]